MISPGSSNKCDQENLLQNPPFPNHPPSPVHFNLVQIQNLNFQEFRLNLRSRLLSQGFPPIIFSVGILSVQILNDIPATSDAFRRIHIKSTLCLSVQLQMKAPFSFFYISWTLVFSERTVSRICLFPSILSFHNFQPGHRLVIRNKKFFSGSSHFFTR